MNYFVVGGVYDRRPGWPANMVVVLSGTTFPDCFIVLTEKGVVEDLILNANIRSRIA